jgi:hypothetical protein
MHFRESEIHIKELKNDVGSETFQPKVIEQSVIKASC